MHSLSFLGFLEFYPLILRVPIAVTILGILFLCANVAQSKISELASRSKFINEANKAMNIKPQDAGMLYYLIYQCTTKAGVLVCFFMVGCVLPYSYYFFNFLLFSEVLTDIDYEMMAFLKYQNTSSVFLNKCQVREFVAQKRYIVLNISCIMDQYRFLKNQVCLWSDPERPFFEFALSFLKGVLVANFCFLLVLSFICVNRIILAQHFRTGFGPNNKELRGLVHDLRDIVRNIVFPLNQASGKDSR